MDGREIKRDDVEKAYRRTNQANATPSEEEATVAKLSVLNDLIVQDILLTKARELKLEVADTELDTAYAEARKDIPEEQFQQELNRRSLSAADMRDGLRREMLAQKVIEREVRRRSPSPTRMSPTSTRPTSRSSTAPKTPTESPRS